MLIITGSLTALLTIGFGLFCALVGSILCYKMNHNIKVAGSVAAYGFTVAPLIIQVWNCFALLLNDAFHLGGPSQIVTSVSFDMALISYAAIYSFFQVTSDIWSTLRVG